MAISRQARQSAIEMYLYSLPEIERTLVDQWFAATSAAVGVRLSAVLAMPSQQVICVGQDLGLGTRPVRRPLTICGAQGEQRGPCDRIAGIQFARI
jgi:hypothetical protein